MKPDDQKRKDRASRRGASLVLVAVLIVVLVGVCGFALDMGYIVLVRTELQRAADAASLAGASVMPEGTAVAETEAYNYAVLNSSGDRRFTRDEVRVEFGQWDRTSRTFAAGLPQPSAIKVTINSRPQSFFFGKIFGYDDFTTGASAVATFQPRDIMLVLDFSGSMCFDSQIRSIRRLGRGPVENNLRDIYRELGSPRLGGLGLTSTFVATNDRRRLKTLLGLNGVPYPYPGDSWDNYLNYVVADGELASNGYNKRYGVLTWINYLQARRESYAETPNLWQTSEQPITAVKDATDVLLSDLTENSPDDRIGMALYTSSNATAIVEKQLTSDFPSISRTVRQRQAGHYVGATNISAGMRAARLELQRNARPGARKLMILMTDGMANLPSPASRARRAVLDEANAAKAAGIPVIAIALGLDADTALMQQVADITGGAFFEIPGGRSVSEYEQQLKEVFSRIASDRQLQLVQ
ncbi:MAG: VWA domain-containing protein [Planctomycetia bacterium]|nr:VWA domain-containing protein [Planctomycetia bacterium]